MGEGYRKVWAQLRTKGIRVGKRRVLRLMREANLLSPSRSFKSAVVKEHEGRITTDRPDEMLGTDQTSALTAEGQPYSESTLPGRGTRAPAAYLRVTQTAITPSMTIVSTIGATTM